MLIHPHDNTLVTTFCGVRFSVIYLLKPLFKYVFSNGVCWCPDHVHAAALNQFPSAVLKVKMRSSLLVLASSFVC